MYLKQNSGESVEKAALTAAAVSSALKLIGRINSLEEIVPQTLEIYRKQQENTPKV